MALFETSRPLVPVTKTGGLQAPRPLVPVTKTSTLAPPGGYGTTTTVFPGALGGGAPAVKPGAPGVGGGGSSPGQPPAPNLSLPGGTAPGLPTGDPSFYDSNYYAAMRAATHQNENTQANVARENQFATQGFNLSSGELARAEPRDVLAQTEAGNNHGLLYAGHLLQQISDTHQNFADRHAALQLQYDSGNAARAAMASAAAQGLSDFQVIQAGAAIDRAITRWMNDLSLGVDPNTDPLAANPSGTAGTGTGTAAGSGAKTTAPGVTGNPLSTAGHITSTPPSRGRPLVQVLKRPTLSRGY